MINVYFNPLDGACKSVTGGVKEKEVFSLSVFLLNYPKSKEWTGVLSDKLRIPTAENCTTPTQNAFLQLNKDGEPLQSYPMQKTPYGWTVSLAIEEIGLYFYSFYIENEGYISCEKYEIGEIVRDSPRGFQLIVSSTEYKTPDWFKGGVMYQIFPDRFAKKGSMPDVKGRIARKWGETPYYRPNEYGKVLNNDFFGGNFQGIMDKLPYLRELGVSILYLNPIFEAYSNHRYDTGNYLKIDPFLGDESLFKELVDRAEKQGIRVILDGVFNHTGDDSVYFNRYGNYDSLGAYQSKDSPYYSWYSFKVHPLKYESWWGIETLPEVNETCEEYQDFIFEEGGVLKKWLTFGIGGYRLDVADELPDFFLKKLRKSVKESDENAIIIGEVWEDASNKVAYSKRREYLQGFELDSVMNYPLKEGIISYIKTEDAGQLLQVVRILIDHYPKQTLDCLMNILGTHDTARILTVLGGIYCKNKDEMALPSAYLDENGKKKTIEKLKMAAVLQFTLPGVPCIYYGDENGMEGHIDPFCRQCFDWEHLNENLISFYQKLGKLRNEQKEIFKDGAFKEIFVEGGFIFYARESGEKRVFVFVNNSSKTYHLKLPKKLLEIISSKTQENEFTVNAYSYGIFIEN